MTIIQDLLREYSSQPERLSLPRAYPLEAAMPGITVLTVPANLLNIEEIGPAYEGRAVQVG